MNPIKKWQSFLEELVNPDSVDTTTIISKNTLAPGLWNKGAGNMRDDVRETALRIAHDFFNSLDLDNIDITDIILTGSTATYNWTDLSDFDLHILIDFNKLENRELMEDYFKEKTKSWNKTHNIMIKGFEVELYIQDSNEPHVANGIYSLMEDRWLKRPTNYRLNIDYDLVKEKAAKLMEDIDDTYDIYAEKDYLLAQQTAEALMEKIRRYRKTGLETGGIYSIENLVFKVLRRNEYLKKLSSIKTLAYDASMSLFERDRDFIKYKK